MDYCSSCRRHLNGALVCPGCGAYAPDIAPVTAHGRTSAAPAATALWPESTGTPDAYDGFDDFPDPDGDVETPASASPGLGRAARRRQRARWKKNQRRAVVATAVALVGGGLTVASMDRGSGHGNQASAATDLSSMGAGEQSVDTSADLPSTTPGTGKHRGPRADEEATTGTSGTSHRGSTTATAPHTDSAKTQRYTVPAPASTPTAAEQATKTVEDTTSTASDTATTATQSPSSTSDGNSGSGSSSTSTSSGSSSSSSGSSGSSQSDSGSASTSPSGICVLNLLCVS
ncbi:hypothetical protein [Streptomyces sp. NPDC047043]|uniref:SCO2400 family protein n=1 Tax=Streptomyces sp. NPDC047043 TaxID=3154497 RepID=UPI0033D76511